MRLLDHFPKGTGFVLVFDYMPSGLWEMIHDDKSALTEPLIKSYMKMLLKGLDHMHKNGIMHRVSQKIIENRLRVSFFC